MKNINNLGGCASPIESLFADAFFRMRPFHGLMIETQFPICRFRYDFAITLNAHIFGPKKPAVLIECDGKAFHSTPKQKRNDQLKNELAAKCGIPLLRFTGSEIYNYPNVCAEKIFLFIRGPKWAS